MNDLIAESIKRFNDLARKEIKHYDNMCDRGDFCICLQDVQADFLKQELTSIAEKTREETLWEISTEVHKMTNKYGEGYMAAVVDVKSILARLNTDKESK